MAEINITNLPSNSKIPKPPEKDLDEKRVESPLTKGKAVVRKESKVKRWIENFVGEDIADLRSYILLDVVLPAIKNGLYDVAGAILGQPRRGSSSSGGTRISYQRYYDDRNRRDDRDRRRDEGPRSVYRFDDVIVDTRGDAEEVLRHLTDLIQDYGCARVADLYDCVGISGSFTDNYWGWTNLRNADYRRVRDGYLLVMPRVENLK